MSGGVDGFRPHARFRRWMLVVAVVAVALRLGATFLLKRWDEPGAGLNRQLASNLVEFGSFSFRDFGYFGPSSVQTPPYPLMLASLFRQFGVGSPTAYFCALAINAFAGALLAVAAAALVRRCVAIARGGLDRTGDNAAILTGVLLAVWPAQILAAQFVQPLAISSVCVVLSCLLWRRATAGDGLFAWMLFSIMCAITTLLQPMLTLAAIAAAVAPLLFRSRPAESRVRNSLMVAGFLVLAWTPWVARNRVVHADGGFSTLFGTRTWQLLWCASNPEATGSDRLRLTPERQAAGPSLAALADDTPDASAGTAMRQIELLSPQQRSELSGKTEAQRERLFQDWTRDLWRSGESPWTRQFGQRFAKAWVIDWDHPMSRHPLAMIPRAILATAAAAAAAIVLVRRQRALVPIVAVLIAAAIAQALSLASAKIVVMLEPLQLALAVAAIPSLWRAKLPQTEPKSAFDNVRNATARRRRQPEAVA